MAISEKAMDKIGEVMRPLTELEPDEFDESVIAIAVMMLGTINKKRGSEFYKDFLQAAIAEPSDIYIEQRPTTRH